MKVAGQDQVIERRLHLGPADLAAAILQQDRLSVPIQGDGDRADVLAAMKGIPGAVPIHAATLSRERAGAENGIPHALEVNYAPAGPVFVIYCLRPIPASPSPGSA